MLGIEGERREGERKRDNYEEEDKKVREERGKEREIIMKKVREERGKERERERLMKKRKRRGEVKVFLLIP